MALHGKQQNEKNEMQSHVEGQGTLYVVATPIGNSQDISQRAISVLEKADIVAAEDTRTSSRLFALLGLKKQMISYHKFNERNAAAQILSHLAEGRDVALVCDAGTPGISDPGAVVVREAARAGYSVVGVSGPSAVVTGVSVSGFDGHFAFGGFFPRTKGEIQKELSRAASSGVPVWVFFESPNRIAKTMDILCEKTPSAQVCLCNDLTKLHERIYRGTCKEVAEQLASNPNAQKGEYTLVLLLAPSDDAGGEAAASGMSPAAILADALAGGQGSLKETIGELAAKYRGVFAKREFYQAALKLRAAFGESDGPGDTDKPEDTDETEDTDVSGI